MSFNDYISMCITDNDFLYICSQDEPKPMPPARTQYLNVETRGHDPRSFQRLPGEDSIHNGTREPWSSDSEDDGIIRTQRFAEGTVINATRDTVWPDGRQFRHITREPSMETRRRLYTGNEATVVIDGIAYMDARSITWSAESTVRDDFPIYGEIEFIIYDTDQYIYDEFYREGHGFRVDILFRNEYDECAARHLTGVEFYGSKSTVDVGEIITVSMLFRAEDVSALREIALEEYNNILRRRT